VTSEQLPVPGGADRKDGEGLFTRGCSDSDAVFQVEPSHVRLHKAL